MNEREMEVFIETSLHVFEKMTQSKPVIDSPVVSFGLNHFYEYNGLIKIQGAAEGVVCLSLPKDMIEEILRFQNDQGAVTPAVALDMVGESASIITSNTRKYFGEQFEVSVPTTLLSSQISQEKFPFSRFTLGITWKTHRASLLLALHTSPTL